MKTTVEIRYSTIESEKKFEEIFLICENEEKVNINDYEDEAKRHLVYELFSKPSTVKKLAKKTYNAVVNGRLIGSCCEWRYAKSLITCCEKEYAIAGIGINSKYIYQTFKVNI